MRVDAALANCLASNGARSRSSHCPGGRRRRCPSAWARIWRLSRLRVTARRACRLGTTRPSHQSTRGALLSTEDAESGAQSVDISGTTVRRGRQTADAGLAARWCSTKCGLLAMTGAVSAAAKSVVFRLRQAHAAVSGRRCAAPCRWPTIGLGAAGKRADAMNVRRPGACGPWRGVRRSPRGRHGSSCAPESRGCVRGGSSRLGKCVSWLGLDSERSRIRETRDYSKKVVSGQRLASQRLGLPRT